MESGVQLDQTPEQVLTGAERVLAEGPITLADASVWWSEFTKSSIHENTVRSWAGDGVELADGSRLCLEVTHVGGRVYTSKMAVTRLVLAQNRAAREARRAMQDQITEASVGAEPVAA